MKYEIQGTVMQIVEVTLDRGESMFTESSSMAWMSDKIDMATGTRGGVGKAIGRVLTGESLFLTTYTSHADNQKIVFSPTMLGKIVPITLTGGESIIAQKDAFLCATQDIDLSVHLRKKVGSRVLWWGRVFLTEIQWQRDCLCFCRW